MDWKPKFLTKLRDVPTPVASKFLKRNAGDTAFEWADAGGGGQPTELVAEIIVSGSAVASISFTGLDGNTHGGYLLEAIIYNPTGAWPYHYNLYYNNDTVDTNYNAIEFQYNNSGGGGGTYNNNKAYMGFMQAGKYGYFLCNINKLPNNMFSAIINWGSTSYDALIGIAHTHRNITTDPNITSVTVKTMDGAANIGVGSQFRIYRRK